MKLVLTGSLGHIGRPLTQKLIQKGHSVTVISSNPAKQTEIEALGAKAAIGSVEDVGFLTEVFSSSDAVYCMIPPDFAQGDQVLYYQTLGNIYAAVIRTTGVKRIIHLSSYGAHLSSGTGFITGSYQVEQILNSIPDVNVTHVRPTFFYYNLLHFIEMIKTAGFIGAVYGGDDKLAMVAPEDIASVIAEELQISSNRSPIRYVTSDDRTCNEVASVLGKAIGMPDLTWLTLPKENVLQALKDRGMPDNAANNLVELGEATHTGKLREDYDQHVPVFGKITLEEYAQEFAEVFKGNM